MPRTLQDILPPPDELIEMEPEEVGPFLLEYLNESGNHKFILNNVLGGLERQYKDLNFYKISVVISESWSWLEREVLIALDPDNISSSQWFIISRKGKKLKNATDFKKYHFGNLLPRENLNPTLLQKVRPVFIRGDYETAVLLAFREVEIQIRNSSKLTSFYGTDLARKAFDADSGPLTDPSLPKTEREAMAHLFAGCIGLFKNPVSHRNIDFENPNEVAELILFSNYLLRLLETIEKNKKII
ncbi:MAG: TIGR02391 family protein [Cyanobacteria bacterium]|nr:TIGR02391 family protein [Cyanobacteriota bacterium]